MSDPIDDLLDSAFRVERTIVSAPMHADAPSQRDVSFTWAIHAVTQGLGTPEMLLPRIIKHPRLVPPPFMQNPKGWKPIERQDLQRTVDSMKPWDFYYALAHGIETLRWPKVKKRMFYRSDVISDTVATLLGYDLREASVLDLACNAGFFAFDIVSRGVKEAHGIELREKSVHQARFLADYYGIRNVDFATGDVYAFEPGRRFDVVLNLGLFYHVTDPYLLARKTYDLCTRFAVFDGVCRPEPFPGFLVNGGVDVRHPVNGKFAFELVPTYRGLIETLYEAGFTKLVEVVGRPDEPIEFYADHTRRTIVAFR